MTANTEAQRRDVLLTVFHNRPYDGDFRTVQRLVAEGSLGEIRALESRFGWWKPDEPTASKAHAGPEAGGGMLMPPPRFAVADHCQPCPGKDSHPHE